MKIVVYESDLDKPDKKSFDRETELFTLLEKNKLEHIFAKLVDKDEKELCIWFEKGDCSLAHLSRERAEKKDIWS
jgi:hypothetical protein